MKTRKKIVTHKLTIWLMGFSVLGLALVQLCLTLGCASASEEIDRLEARASVLEEEVLVARQEIDRLGSLSSIQARATTAGFVKTSQVFYLPAQAPVALGF